ncbi:MAG: DUF547 domain-containing protein [Hyphomicrobiales bacterium]
MGPTTVFNAVRNRYLRAACAALLVAAFQFSATTGRAAELAEVFSKSDEASTATVDHGPWDRLIAKYLKPGASGVALFDYGAVTGKDRQALKAYLARLQAVRVSKLARRSQMPYWINLYNALTVDVILDNYPVKSIREIKSGLFSSGPWGTELVKVEGHDLSLDDIEHAILRPIWRDKRIHYVVNCASIGCPNLVARAYTEANTPDLLEQGARDYINNPRGVRVEKGRVIASKLFRWYDDDFGTEQELFAHIRKYAAPELLAKLNGKSRIYDYEYDWALNRP